MQYKTKDGDPIIFVVYDPDPDDNPSPKKGFVVSRIDAYVRPRNAPPLMFEMDEYLGEHAGYLKISFVPKERWDTLITSPLQFANRWYGKWYGAPVDDMDAMYTYFRKWHTTWPPYEETTPEERLQYVEDKLSWDLERIEEQMATSYAFHVDKPLVDYIRIFEPWQHKGIALALYNFGAEWLALEKGLRLYASGIQQPPAKRIWEYMEESPLFPTGREWWEHDVPEYSRERRFLDYT